MLPIYMIQSQVFWLRGKPLRNIQPFNGFAPMQDIERLLNKMFPKNSALVLILLHARKLDGRFYLSGGLWSVLWPGSTIPAVFPKTMKCLSVLHKLFAPLLPSALYSSGFSLLVQLLIWRNQVWLFLHQENPYNHIAYYRISILSSVSTLRNNSRLSIVSLQHFLPNFNPQYD